jgi:hypothetical protein
MARRACLVILAIVFCLVDRTHRHPNRAILIDGPLVPVAFSRAGPAQE